MFTFNGNYKDLSQVVPFLPAYSDVLHRLEAAGKYPYNDSFIGQIPGIEGDEDSAIYLLQRVRGVVNDALRVNDAIDRGYRPLDRSVVTETPQRFAGVVTFGWFVGGTGFAEWAEAPRLFRWNGQIAVLTKGKRTKGHRVDGEILVKP